LWPALRQRAPVSVLWREEDTVLESALWLAAALDSSTTALRVNGTSSD